MQKQKNVSLILDDGSRFSGISFGYERPTAGEVVFNTAMSGYPESLTDPSYSGQIMVLTYPLIGNYGVPARSFSGKLSTFLESEKIHADGIIVSDYSENYSHWNATESLGEWLKQEKITGITGIDTRELTKLLREKGSMIGKIVFSDENEIDFIDPNKINQVARVSTTEIITYGNGKKRCLLKRNVTVIRVPWDYDFNAIEYDGLFISNGPGDPDTCGITVKHIREAMKKEKPIFGICMGNQLLAKAGGANTYKLKYGHRSHNQPVRLVGTEKCFITSQNHGFAVDNNTLNDEWTPLFVNMNDGTNEGIQHKNKPFFSVQFHPEAASGPTDTEFLFDRFIEMI